MADHDPEAAAGIRRRLEKSLADGNCRFNPDEDLVGDIIEAIAARKAKFGEAYCPCRRLSGDPGKDREIICPCVHREREIATDGYCHCRLFVRKEGS
ncbi:MAG: ferredoxin:thioredoxin reductase [Planctomycetota bacterium]|jgi:ferredoxin-thioredoxin reductase catalytic subunit|nr:ferredoxin:thioredoxin reductase [Planctomycetota bacterium]